MYVVTIDQRASRDADLVEELLARLHTGDRAERLTRRFERTADRELQGIVGSADDAVSIVLELVRADAWSVGLGLGPVRNPLPDSVLAASGAAFENARSAVDNARVNVRHLAVHGPAPEAAAHAEALLQLLAALIQRRTPQGWEVVDLLAAGHTQREIAAALGISNQAVSQRVRVSLWSEESRARPLAARLLARADR